VHRRAEALAAEFAAADPLNAAGRRALLDQLADGVESAVALEQRTVDVLT